MLLKLGRYTHLEVRCHMEYCSHRFAGAPAYQSDPFESIQKQALRLVHNPILAGDVEPLILRRDFASLCGGGVQFGEESCDTAELNVCVGLIPRKPAGLPRNKYELDEHCRIYNTGMSCMDTWIKRCLPTDGQKYLQQQIGGARALMRFLCANDTAMRRDFLREPTCWGRVSPAWTNCVNELQVAVRDSSDRDHRLTYFHKNAELCCARDDFLTCVANAGRPCSMAASTLLRRMAWVLAHDIASCAQQPRAYCSAPPRTLTAPILTAIYGIIFYRGG